MRDVGNKIDILNIEFPVGLSLCIHLAEKLYFVLVEVLAHLFHHPYIAEELGSEVSVAHHRLANHAQVRVNQFYNLVLRPCFLRRHLVEAVAELRPDVLVLSETSTAEVSMVEDATGLRAVSPVLRRTPGAGTAILVGDGQAREVSEDTGITRHQMPVAELGGPADPQATIAGVHTNTPVHRDLLGGWLQEMEDLRDWVDDTATSQDHPVILAGDFNATMSHPEFRHLVHGADLERCAASAMGPATWPAVVPVVRLDHILVAGASCGDSGTLRVEGSDHQAIWADVHL